VKASDLQMDATEAALTEVAEQGERIGEMAREIADASAQQSSASEAIAAEIDRIAAAADTTLGTVERTRQGAASLAQTAVRLDALIRFFRYIRPTGAPSLAPARAGAASGAVRAAQSDPA
jgi:methyl-accepting chemotaxis protein